MYQSLTDLKVFSVTDRQQGVARASKNLNIGTQAEPKLEHKPSQYQKIQTTKNPVITSSRLLVDLILFPCVAENRRKQQLTKNEKKLKPVKLRKL